LTDTKLILFQWFSQNGEVIMRRPFTLYKEITKSGTIWYARFWDEAIQKYKHSRSTGILVEGKKERRYEAEEAARKLYEGFTATKLTVSQPNTPTTQTSKILNV
jgi:hypothetical protein